MARRGDGTCHVSLMCAHVLLFSQKLARPFRTHPSGRASAGDPLGGTWAACSSSSASSSRWASLLTSSSRKIVPPSAGEARSSVVGMEWRSDTRGLYHGGRDRIEMPCMRVVCTKRRGKQTDLSCNQKAKAGRLVQCRRDHLFRCCSCLSSHPPALSPSFFSSLNAIAVAIPRQVMERVHDKRSMALHLFPAGIFTRQLVKEDG